ncbi:Serine hydrolase [Colletotrichum higginsianum IMI 349063]|uniref:Serine hydrolase n=3 Tax=Colletotrichum higginsianum TaxID=80884 RepID=A0A1B7Y8K1_COLHI|nr:Serine hydrolase [Colletotrichum higginsianum IMI 349063]OBR08278.1 Serine hydrolase [Colletotrichum higginsianum IMI 349063]TIC96182.1 Dihydrofolate reductase [Colletotrichum higginsianum]
MSTANGSAPNGAAAKKPNGKQEIKILMLHGYTQSGPLFRSKTRALEKLIAKSLGPFNIAPTLTYPTGPSKLSPRDIPGFVPDESGGDQDQDIDAWSWWRKDEASGSYRFLAEGVSAVADAVREAGGDVDGVLGFSQGGAFAALLAAMLETPHRDEAKIPEDLRSAVRALREANGGRPFKFAVIYSGFFAPPDELRWAYEPRITTPTLHFLGSLDTVVEESRSRGLVDRCEDPLVVVHPGGHYVPITKEWAMPLIGFIKKIADEEKAKSNI